MTDTKRSSMRERTQDTMTRPWPGIVVAGLCYVNVGCTATTEIGHNYYVYKNARGQEVLTSKPCGTAVDPCNASMNDAVVTNDPVDEEFWQFEARVPVRGWLIPVPYGRMPTDYNVIGSRERCEAARAAFRDPTEPCKGPFYFRRQATE